MIRPRQWLPDVILVPGPARFDSPQLAGQDTYAEGVGA